MYNALLKCSKGHVNQIIISSLQDLDSIDEMCKLCTCSTCGEAFNDEEWKYVKTIPLVP